MQFYKSLAVVAGLVSSEDKRTKVICYHCVARLRNAQRLCQLALHSDEVLTRLLRSDTIEDIPTNLQTDILSWKLSVLVLENIDISNGEYEVKFEEHEEYQIKVEKTKEDEDNDPPILSDVENNLEDCTSIKENSDSEDDLPLTNLTASKENRDKRKSKRKYNTDVKVDAVEIILSHEQQMNELRERAKSLNYLNSPYKCDFCYKGFLQVEAYENHKEKHSKSSGPLECGVCRLRYGSARQLRAHRAAAHERRYACTRCPHAARTRNQAIAHEKWHDGHLYPCELCGEKFSKPTSYLTHARTAHGGGHACAQCGRSFVGRHGLAMHVSKANCTTRIKGNPEEPSEKSCCKDCDIQFNSVDAWKRHVLTSVKHRQWDEKSPDCSICNVHLSPNNWRSHMRSHARAMRAEANASSIKERCEPMVMLPCDQCESKFSSQSRLHAHVRRVHLGLKYNKNFVCEVCGKKCTSAATLRYHQRRHTGERPYACLSCTARFADSHQLRVHARTHSGERPYRCERCGKRFSQKPALNRHYRVSSTLITNVLSPLVIRMSWMLLE
ncbi:uncharacterized protein [Epargyreus clarus]|uniref:uncharacterized protein isoform X1 n=1 Tax=Epargyreus clarus TaxID=520877 RepID=UPI003C2D823D